jgi:hypothetical protein
MQGTQFLLPDQWGGEKGIGMLMMVGQRLLEAASPQ